MACNVSSVKKMFYGEFKNNLLQGVRIGKLMIYKERENYRNVKLKLGNSCPYMMALVNVEGSGRSQLGNDFKL